MTNQFPDLKDIERRPQRYWNADGLPEIAMGALWILWGAALGIPEALPPGDWLKWYWMTVPLILVVSGLAAGWVTKKLKAKLTFPRGGYVAWPEPGPLQRIIPALLAMAVAAGVVALVVKGESQTMREVAAPACSLLLAAAFLIPVLRWNLTHCLVLSAVSLVLAFVMIRARLVAEHGMILLFLGLGPVSVLTGALRLRAFLRRHPLPAEVHP